MRLFTLVPLILLGACAGTPKARPTPAAPPAAAAVAATATPEVASGQTKICKKTLRTGTRLHYDTRCLTEAEWKEASDAARAAIKPTPVASPK